MVIATHVSQIAMMNPSALRVSALICEVMTPPTNNKIPDERWIAVIFVGIRRALNFFDLIG